MTGEEEDAGGVELGSTPPSTDDEQRHLAPERLTDSRRVLEGWSPPAGGLRRGRAGSTRVPYTTRHPIG